MSSSLRRSAALVSLAATIIVPLALSTTQFARMPGEMSATALLLIGGALTRRVPPVGLGLAAAAVFVATSTGQGPWPWLGAAVVAFLCGRGRAAGRMIWLTLIIAVVAIVSVTAALWADPIELLLTLVGTVVIPWWIGSDARVRESLRDAGWDRAERLEREQRFAVNAVRQEERTRLAAEMHDALGYELSVLALTAGAGEVDTANTPEQRLQFTRTREAAVRAVHSLHDVLRILRADESGDEIAPDALDALIAVSAEQGMDLRASLTVDPSSWAPALRRGVHRMIQELLANAARHAPNLAVDLTVAEDDDRISIRAHNGRTAQAAASPGSGSGLAGIAERARVLGGTMSTSEGPNRFEVVISLPVRTPVVPPPEVEPRRPTVTAERRRQTHRRWRTALIPIIAVAICAGMLLALNALTVERIGISTASFEDLRVGMPIGEAERLLPPSHLDEPPAVLAEPEAPEGSQCRYYRHADSWLDLGTSYLRLCFADDTLTLKERVR